MLWVVSGTGTGIGKTAAATALVRTLRAKGAAAVGWKPVETGVVAGQLGADQEALLSESTFHVKHKLHCSFLPAVSPHLASRLAGIELQLEPWVRHANELRATCHLVIELAGGLFTPLTDSQLNVDLVAMLKPDCHILVAPDRLGVLHDAIASLTAAKIKNAAPHFVLLNQSTAASASLFNASELARFASIPILGPLPFAPIEERAAKLALWLQRSTEALDPALISRPV